MSAGQSAQRRADELLARAAQAEAQAQVAAAEARRRAVSWAKGADGERRVAAELTRLGPDVLAVHDRLLDPGRSRVNLDHIVVTSAGAFVLDAKNWSGDLTVHRGALWVHSGPREDRRHWCCQDELVKVGWYAGTMTTVLCAPVRPVVVLASVRHAGFPPQCVAGIDVVPVGRLREWFLRQPVCLRDVDRDLLAIACAESFPDTEDLGGTEYGPAWRVSRLPQTRPALPRNGARPSVSSRPTAQYRPRPPHRPPARYRPRTPYRARPAPRQRTPPSARQVIALFAFLLLCPWLLGFLGSAATGTWTPPGPATSVTAPVSPVTTTAPHRIP